MSAIINTLKKIYWACRGSNFRGLLMAVIYKGFRLPLIVRKGGKYNNLSMVSAGKRVVIADHVELFLNPINRNTRASLVLGNYVSIGRYTIIGCSNQITIEDNVTIAPHVHLTDRNHEYKDINTPICNQPADSPGPILIKSDSWIGFGAQIMPGVTIGKHCVIAAGSVVTKDIPDYSIAVGIPAKVVKQYSFKDGKWVKVSRPISIDTLDKEISGVNIR